MIISLIIISETWKNKLNATNYILYKMRRCESEKETNTLTLVFLFSDFPENGWWTATQNAFRHRSRRVRDDSKFPIWNVKKNCFFTPGRAWSAEISVRLPSPPVLHRQSFSSEGSPIPCAARRECCSIMMIIIRILLTNARSFCLYMKGLFGMFAYRYTPTGNRRRVS